MNRIEAFYQQLSRRQKRWIFRVLDILAVTLSIYLAFSLRFDIFSVSETISPYWKGVLLLYPIKLISFWLVGLYRPVIRYVGIEFLTTALFAVMSSAAALSLITLMTGIKSLPRSIFILDIILTLVFIITVRVLVRWTVYRALELDDINDSSEAVLIFGAGGAGCELSYALSQTKRYKVMAFIDDNKQLQNQVIGGLKVHHRKAIPKLSKKHKIKSILLAIPRVSRSERLNIVHSIQPAGLQIKTVPGIRDILSGKIEISKIRNIDITDLLGREEVQSHPDLLEKNILNQVVMVTGAGGSIGSELCRQILLLKPQKLIIYERNELALFNIDNELRTQPNGTKIVTCLSSVTDKKQMEKVMTKHRVDTIYHAAAYKHVPLIEKNLSSGIFNNINGTLCCVEAAVSARVKTVVLISTDKAVRPTNIMGTTKRISEMILQAFAEDPQNITQFMMVRFGNVLNSTGSVVPHFRSQIAKGKDLTVTHKEITRYFMSIPESARLVIQAGALGKTGSVFLLDMGEPVKIYDLALQMIKLSGLELGHDINIKITGLRPGEKLFEELLIDINNSTATQHPKIFSAEEHFMSWDKLSPALKYLFQIASTGTQREIVQALQNIVPEFTPDPRYTSNSLSVASLPAAPAAQKVIPISKKTS
ncbi:MAG: polysaccharide biosynthesis protein [Proteobacteria bacterium]|nr:polysaccharide biosynthesis protein [Pseudomonadota bacterium]